MNPRRSLSRFRQALSSGQVLLMDGAVGTQLQRAGIAQGECYEHWNVIHPSKVRAIHQAYVDAGALCLLTNTFQANPRALAKHGLTQQLTAICSTGVDIARSVAGEQGFVLGDIGPICDLGSPLEFPDPAEAEQVVAALANADAILFETCSDPAVLQAIRGCQTVCVKHDLPVLLSLTYLKDSGGELITRSGLAPEWFAEQAAEAGIAALGVNCGREIGMDEILEIVQAYRRKTSLPLFARPNAGTPTKVSEGWQYPLTPAAMAQRGDELLDVGVTLLGGCCGTGPEHIAALRAALQNKTDAPTS